MKPYEENVGKVWTVKTNKKVTTEKQKFFWKNFSLT